MQTNLQNEFPLIKLVSLCFSKAANSGEYSLSDNSQSTVTINAIPPK
jgi:hypothetical protein